MNRDDIIRQLFDKKEIRKLFIEDRVELDSEPQERYSVQINAEDILRDEEKSANNKDELVHLRIGELISELSSISQDVQPSSKMFFDISVNESSMSDPRIRQTIDDFIKKFKNNESIEGENSNES